MAHQMMLNSITTNIDYLFSDLITRYRLLRAIPHVFKPYRSNPNKPNYTPPLDDDCPTQLNPKSFDTTKLMLLAAVAVGNVFDTPSRSNLSNESSACMTYGLFGMSHLYWDCLVYIFRTAYAFTIHECIESSQKRLE
eukprot:254897_1